MPENQQGQIVSSHFLRRDFFQRDPVSCARDLIGVEFHWEGCAGIVVETEAYSEHGDEACHTFFRPSARRFIETHEAGSAYVYFNYGMYWLTNILTKDPRSGERGFVLLRALEPSVGLDQMRKRRRRNRDVELCSGPGKLSMALGISGDHHGNDLVTDFRRGFHRLPGRKPPTILTDQRVGISKAQDLPWRFLADPSQWVSRPFGKT
ncbi:MAG: DNA-3-methyladenine glycosylase [Verrucomicrobiae bacterium]|nr:DNA-3-methyladenine glycosylase [Verrucomicrobiae bacterium]